MSTYWRTTLFLAAAALAVTLVYVYLKGMTRNPDALTLGNEAATVSLALWIWAGYRAIRGMRRAKRDDS